LLTRAVQKIQNSDGLARQNLLSRDRKERCAALESVAESHTVEGRVGAARSLTRAIAQKTGSLARVEKADGASAAVHL
jgi:hypothetical protein